MIIDKIKHLYLEKKLSTREVGKLLKLTQWSVIALMRKYKIPRRKSAETLKIQFEKTPLSFNKKVVLSSAEEKLYRAALMLYWAEGAKARIGIVDFSNCNKEMVLIFLSVLREIYRICEDRIRIYLYCHQNQKVDDLIIFWSKELNIPKKQFTKPYIKTGVIDLGKSDKMPYGLIHIRYNDKRLHEQILKDIAIIVTELSRGGRAVKCTGL